MIFRKDKYMNYFSKTKSPNIIVILLSIFLIAVIACSTNQLDEQSNDTSASIEYHYTTTTLSTSVLITKSSEDNSIIADSISITPEEIVLKVGESIQLDAKTIDKNSQIIPNSEIVWNLSDPRSGSITKEGIFTAGRNSGTFTQAISVVSVQNSPKGIHYTSKSISVTVIGETKIRHLSYIDILPSNPTVVRHQIRKLQAVGYDENGVIIPGVKFIWKLEKPEIGKLNQLGYLTVEGIPEKYTNAISVTGIWKNTEIKTSNHINIIESSRTFDDYNVQALPQKFYTYPEDKIHLRAIALNGLGEIASGTQLRWEMVNRTAGSIDGNGNFIAGTVPGIYPESIKVEAVIPSENGFVKTHDYSSVVIRNVSKLGPLEYIEIMPNSIAIEPESKIIIRAIGKDKNGRTVETSNRTWKIFNNDIGTIDELGIFKSSMIPGIYPNALEISLIQNSDSGIIERKSNIDVTITGTLNKGKAYPELGVVETNKTIHFSAIGFDENNIQLHNTIVKWEITDESVGKIDKYGNFTAYEKLGLYKDLIKAEILQRRPLSKPVEKNSNK